MKLAINGIAIMDAQNPNLSSVKILKAFDPKSNFGKGVVPPLPKIIQIKKEMVHPQNLLYFVMAKNIAGNKAKIK